MLSDKSYQLINIVGVSKQRTTTIARSISTDSSVSVKQSDSSTDAIEKYLSDKNVQLKVSKRYNDSVIQTLQANLSSLKVSSEMLRMSKLREEDVPGVIAALASDYGFNDTCLKTQFQKQPKPIRFSYEDFFDSSATSDKSTTAKIQYVWILAEKKNDSTCSVYFVYLKIDSKSVINTLFNVTNKTKPNVISTQKLHIIRTSKLNDDGKFSQERSLKSLSPWKVNVTNVALEIMRFTSAGLLVPSRHRMLSQFNPDVILPENNFQSTKNGNTRGLTSILNPIKSLTDAISGVAKTWKDLVSAFKTTKSGTVSNTIRFGFKYFQQKSHILKVMNIPAARVQSFIDAIQWDYDLPTRASFVLGITYSNDFTWDQVNFLYSPDTDGKYCSLTLLKTGDSNTNTASFYIISVEAYWKLASDLLIVTRSKSKLGGIFESTKQSITEVPHALTLDEATQLQKFFITVATSNLALTLGVNITLPSVN